MEQVIIEVSKLSKAIYKTETTLEYYALYYLAKFVLSSCFWRGQLKLSHSEESFLRSNLFYHKLQIFEAVRWWGYPT
jgi:hypothetical protein